MEEFMVNGAGDTMAHFACQVGDMDKLRWSYKKCPTILQIKNKIGKVPLHDAALHGHLECMKFVLSKKVDPDPLKRGDWTPLMLACTKSNLDIIKNLIGSGSDSNLVNKDGWNCLHIAVRGGQLDIIKFLLNTDLNLLKNKSKNGRTPLHTAALYGHLEVTKLLLEDFKINPDERDNCGTTPFMDAVKSGHISVAHELLSTNMVDVAAEDYIGGRQALHLASEAGCCDGLKFLLHECGVPINTLSNIFHESPLHLSAKEGHVNSTKLLLEFGAERSMVDSKNRTASHVAILNKKMECANLLQDFENP